MLHKSPPAVNETEEREGFRVTTPLRTLPDVSAQETVTKEQLNHVVEQTLSESLVRRAKLREAVECQKSDSRLRQGFSETTPVTDELPQHEPDRIDVRQGQNSRSPSEELEIRQSTGEVVSVGLAVARKEIQTDQRIPATSEDDRVATKPNH